MRRVVALPLAAALTGGAIACSPSVPAPRPKHTVHGAVGADTRAYGATAADVETVLVSTARSTPLVHPDFVGFHVGVTVTFPKTPQIFQPAGAFAVHEADGETVHPSAVVQPSGLPLNCLRYRDQVLEADGGNREVICNLYFDAASYSTGATLTYTLNGGDGDTIKWNMP